MNVELQNINKSAEAAYEQSDFARAIHLYNQVIQSLPLSEAFEHAELWRKMGNAYFGLEDWDNCRICYENSLIYYQDNDSIYAILGWLYYYFDAEKSVDYYEKALSMNLTPASFVTQALAMLKCDGYSQSQLRHAFEEKVTQLRKDLLAVQPAYKHEKVRRHEKIRVAYLSSDFKSHAMMQFILPLLEQHDQERFDFRLYSTTTSEDTVTERIRATGMDFVSCSDLSNVELAQRIYGDEIDILIDLSGYTHERSFALIYKPAPVQMQYLGFVNSLGMSEIDYIWADDFILPEREQAGYTEQALYLETRLHRFDFNVKDQALPELKAAPFLEKGYLTFGSFNDLSKLSPQTIRLWARLLQALPDSKLLIYRTNMFTEAKKKAFIEDFSELGIAAERLILRSDSLPSHFEAYQLADIALDPLPFSGLTITIEEAFMGLPSLTLPGQTMQSRGTASVNRTLGMTDWIAQDEEDFINKAVAISQDLPKLASTKTGLREKIAGSKLCSDSENFARAVENALDQAWIDWLKP